MNKLFKYSVCLLAAVMVFVACKDNEDEESTVTLSGPQTYFNTESPTVIDISKEETSFTVTINRANTAGELTVPITATLPEGSPFTIPESVTFADGAETADIVITYDPTKLEYGDYTDITLTIGDASLATPYGVTAYTFSVGATAWKSIGKGTYRDDLYAPLYDKDIPTYEVEVEKNIVEEGMYRIKNPYGKDFPYADDEDYKYDKDNDHYLIINATDPNYVWFYTCEPNTEWDENGKFFFTSYVQYFLDSGYPLAVIKAQVAQLFGMYDKETGIISMPEPGSALFGFDGELWDTTNASGRFALALPGFKLTDYSIAYEMLGRFIDAKGQIYAQGVATLGDDIASAKAALVTEETYLEVYQSIIDGTAGDEVVDIESEVPFLLPFTTSGVYYVLIVGFDENGEVVADSDTRVKLDNPAEGAGTTWEAAYVGDYCYDLFSTEEDPDIQEGMVLSVDAKDENHMMLAPWMDETHQLEFNVNEDGSITVPEQESGYNEDGEMSVMDVISYTNGNEQYAQYVSKIEKGVITLYLVYFNDNHTYRCMDTYTITGLAETASKQKVNLAPRKLTKKTKKVKAKPELSLRLFKKGFNSRMKK